MNRTCLPRSQPPATEQIENQHSKMETNTPIIQNEYAWPVAFSTAFRLYQIFLFYEFQGICPSESCTRSDYKSDLTKP